MCDRTQGECRAANLTATAAHKADFRNQPMTFDAPEKKTDARCASTQAVVSSRATYESDAFTTIVCSPPSEGARLAYDSALASAF